MINRKFLLTVYLGLVLSGCASIRTNTDFYYPILTDLKRGEYNLAAEKIDRAEIDEEYSNKDRVLLHLDKGIIYHYQGEYERSNKELEKAELAIEELFTKSISKAAISLLLNDNALAYSGEVYEDLYINIFKALNYLHLRKFDDAFVEVHRVNNKLQELDVKYEEEVKSLNESEDKQFDIQAEKIDYYNNVLSHYLSHLIYRADGAYDDSRISLEKAKEAWETYPDVYNYEMPVALAETTSERGVFLNIIAFVGKAPIKEPVGARITTFDDFVVVSDPTEFYATPIPIPGIKYGWNFKFEFPQIIEEGTEVYGIEVLIDSVYYGEMELLENMCNIAAKTFETEKGITYFKTVARAVLKGIGSSSLGRTIKKDVKGTLGDILVGVVNVVVDATENADLRSWRTMPGYCFVAEFQMEKGIYNIEIRFLNQFGEVISNKTIEKYKVTSRLNLVEAVHLN